MALQMTYGSYTWPHNPHTLNLRLSRRIAVHKGAFSGDSVQDMGEDIRVCSGAGDFYGPVAHDDFYRLLAIFERGGAELLALPGLTPFIARFKALDFTEKAGPQIISYNFTFIEDTKKSALSLGRVQFYTAAQGDNLWTISLKFGIDINDLLALNKNFSSPFDVKAGQTVKLY